MTYFSDVPSIILILVASFIVSLISNIVMKLTMDHHKMRNIKERMEKLREKMKSENIKKNPEKYNDILSEQYSLLNEQMKASFKTMMINLVFLVPLFYYLKKSVGILSFALPFNLPFFGNEVSWIWIYIYYSILFSLVMKKLLKLDY